MSIERKNENPFQNMLKGALKHPRDHSGEDEGIPAPRRVYKTGEEARKSVEEYAKLAAERDLEKMVSLGRGPAELATDEKLRKDVLAKRADAIKTDLNRQLDGMAEYTTKNGFLLINLADPNGEVKKYKVRFDGDEAFHDFQNRWVRVDMPEIENERDLYKKHNKVTATIRENKGKLTDEQAKDLVKLNAEVSKHAKKMGAPEITLKQREYVMEKKILENKETPTEADVERIDTLKKELKALEEKIKNPPKVQEERQPPKPPIRDEARFAPEADPKGAQEIPAEMFTAMRAFNASKGEGFVSERLPQLPVQRGAEIALAV